MLWSFRYIIKTVKLEKNITLDYVDISIRAFFKIKLNLLKNASCIKIRVHNCIYVGILFFFVTGVTITTGIHSLFHKRIESSDLNLSLKDISKSSCIRRHA